MRKLRAPTSIVAIVCACGTAAAQPAKEPASLTECAAIEAAVARLDCFDALARRERAGAAPARDARSAESPARETQSEARPQSSESARFLPRDEQPEAARVSRREARAADREQLELTSQVTALREIQPGRLEVTLANGQVWRQTNTERYNLLVGHEVRVYPSGFGQYFRLTSKEARGFIQVERVR